MIALAAVFAFAAYAGMGVDPTVVEKTNIHDVTGDKKVNGLDVSAVYDAIEEGATVANLPNADVNKDSKINGLDVSAIYDCIESPCTEERDL